MKVNLSPKDGYYFKESDNSVHRANSWGGLTKKVTRYRALNKMPPGNPEQEIAAQACSRQPTLCFSESRVTKQQTQRASLKGRVLAWLSHRRKNPGALVFTSNPQEVEGRKEICAQCPHNTALVEGCSSCRNVVKALRADILGGGRAIDGRLHGCAVIGQDNPTAVYLEDQTLPEPALPDICWRKRRL